MTENITLTELTYEECLAFLRQERVGRIAVIADPFPLVFPVNYRMVEASGPSNEPGHVWIAIRTRRGNTIDRAGRFVSFQIDGHHEGTRLGWSVLVTGTLHRVDVDASDFRVRYDPEPWLLEERDHWLVIHPVQTTGRCLSVDTAEWAFVEEAYL